MSFVLTFFLVFEINFKFWQDFVLLVDDRYARLVFPLVVEQCSVNLADAFRACIGLQLKLNVPHCIVVILQINAHLINTHSLVSPCSDRPMITCVNQFSL